MIEITIQIDDNLFNRFKSYCEAMDIAISDYIESLVSQEMKEIVDAIDKVFTERVKDFPRGE